MRSAARSPTTAVMSSDTYMCVGGAFPIQAFTVLASTSWMMMPTPVLEASVHTSAVFSCCGALGT
jgi:hypothetical protein